MCKGKQLCITLYGLHGQKIGPQRYVCCRAASALQEAAAEHKKRTGRPFVLIIDAVDRLAEHAPDILETLQARQFVQHLPCYCVCSSLFEQCTSDTEASVMKGDNSTHCMHALLIQAVFSKPLFVLDDRFEQLCIPDEVIAGQGMISCTWICCKVNALMPCNAPWLQDFSKDWAEQMIVSVVLVCSEPQALHILHSKQTHASMLQLPWTGAVFPDCGRMSL